MVFRTNLLLAGCLSFLLSTSGPAAAQDIAPEVDLQPLPQEVSVEFDQILAEIEEEKEDIKRIEGRLADFEGVSAAILGDRRDNMWAVTFHKTLELARGVALGSQFYTLYQDASSSLDGRDDDAFGNIFRLLGRK